MSRCKQTDHGGFTLVEVLITVLVMGIIMSLAGASLSKARKASRIQEAQAQCEILASAILQLAWDTGQWPGGKDRTQLVWSNNEFEDLTVGAVGLLSNSGVFTDWRGPYIHNIPKDPWGNNYFFDADYRIKGALPNIPVVGSYGPNGVGMNVYDDDDIIVRLD